MPIPLIAIIDEGVDSSYSKLKNCLIEHHYVHERDGADGLPDHNNLHHGTSIATIIHEGCPDAPLLSVQMIPEKKINVKLLCKALQYCATRRDISIITISLGILTDAPSAELHEACLNCHTAGKIIIASAHTNTKKKCYPAAFPFVFGVGVGLAKDLGTFKYLGEGYINILARGTHQRVLIENGRADLRGGTSYAAAAFASITANFFKRVHRFSIELFKDMLRTRSSADVRTAHYPVDPSSYASLCSESPAALQDVKALLFPTDDASLTDFYSKHNIVERALKYPLNPFREFDLPDDLGIRHMEGVLSPKIFNYANTLLLGNFLANKYLINVYFGYALIDLCIKYQINFIVTNHYIKDIIFHSIKNGKIQFNGRIIYAAEVS